MVFGMQQKGDWAAKKESLRLSEAATAKSVVGSGTESATGNAQAPSGEVY